MGTNMRNGRDRQHPRGLTSDRYWIGLSRLCFVRPSEERCLRCSVGNPTRCVRFSEGLLRPPISSKILTVNFWTPGMNAESFACEQREKDKTRVDHCRYMDRRSKGRR